MGEIATSNKEIILYYNSNSARAKQALAYAKVEGIPVQEFDILKNPPTGTQLAEIAKGLGLEIKDLVNQEHPAYKTQFEQHTFSSDDWIKMIRKNPEIMKQPIALHGDKIKILAEPKELLRM
ncbi:hypothetical protein DNU06_06785 [Putridiphycobacter roseus]|uniref:Arsenate reductase n=1 Tax=Putridiphycobacter roseus TaxID=2219161 RepID=A0A2W1NST2_9FLAO|nr:ArsC/Spx/MgsR family protein [Putridiphycobacter roseus]PZE17738.1 hypothetical protein DNU06_06785 [Putridiphycobacter roseus]